MNLKCNNIKNLFVCFSICLPIPRIKYYKIANEATVSLLAKNDNVKILNVKNKWDMDALDYAVYFGHISIFSFLVLTLFDKYNISNIKDVRKILSEENMKKWINWCEEEKKHRFIFIFNKFG